MTDAMEDLATAFKLNQWPGRNPFAQCTCIQGLWYLEAFIMESLRMYPLTPLERITVKPYRISGSGIDFVIPKGMLVQVPSGVMKDEKYFKDPNKFDPENFNSENKS